MSDRREGTPTSIGRYEIVELLGSGAMGDVYLARDPRIDRQLAIKTVRVLGAGAEDVEERTQRLLREARAAGKLLHPHVVTLFDADEVDGLLYLAFEFVPGTDLAQRARREPPLSLREVLRVVREVASALDYAHGREIVHRDIKPSNILLGADGEAKVADFGIAKLYDQSTELTRTGSVVGSPQYMSPEQVRGEALDGRSDVFSLGVVLYEMLCRIRPFNGDTISTLVFQILAEDPTPIDRRRPGLEPRLASLVHRMLAKDRDQRVASASGVVEAIHALEAELPTAMLDAPAALGPDQAPTQRIASSGAQAPPTATMLPPVPPTAASAPPTIVSPPPVPPSGSASAPVAPAAGMPPPPGVSPPTAPPAAPPVASPVAPPPGAPSTVPPTVVAPPPAWDASTGTYAGPSRAKTGWIVALLIVLLVVAGAGGWIVSRILDDRSSPTDEIADGANGSASDDRAFDAEGAGSGGSSSDEAAPGNTAPDNTDSNDAASDDLPTDRGSVDSAQGGSTQDASTQDTSTQDASASGTPTDQAGDGDRRRPPPPLGPRAARRRAAAERLLERRERERAAREEAQARADTSSPSASSASPGSVPPLEIEPSAPPPPPPAEPRIPPLTVSSQTAPSQTAPSQTAPSQTAPSQTAPPQTTPPSADSRTRLERVFDEDAARAVRTLDTGRSFRFDVDPPDTIVKFRRRGDRSIVQGQVEEFEAGKRKKENLELPGDGEYLIYLVSDGAEALFHVRVDSARSGPHVIVHSMRGGGS
ncbi:MAG: serine/threonine-protein kinase [Acidobacteriota bacterium]